MSNKKNHLILLYAWL